MSGCGIKNTVTIVTHRHRSFGGVQGDLFKGQPCWGGNPQLPGQRPTERGIVLRSVSPSESANSIF